MNIINETRNLIEKAIAEIDKERESLSKALSHLGGGSSAKRAGSPRKEPSAPPKPRRKKAAKGQRREEVLTAIRAQPGIKASEIAKKIGIPPSQAHGIAASLVKAKEVSKKGPEFTATPMTEAAKAEKEPVAD